MSHTPQWHRAKTGFCQLTTIVWLISAIFTILVAVADELFGDAQAPWALEEAGVAAGRQDAVGFIRAIWAVDVAIALVCLGDALVALMALELCVAARPVHCRKEGHRV